MLRTYLGPILPGFEDIANSLRITKGESIWPHSHDVSIAVVKISKRNFCIPPAVEQSLSVCERGQQRASEASEVMDVTKR